MVKDSPKFAEIAKQFLDFISGGILVGHNIMKFDIPFINSELKAANFKIIDNQIIDIYKIFQN
jgi:DNA polymerase-3 subunit epsilon